MDWFFILKNQVASTKGKTFSLDFSQPMVEDTNCKDKLRELANRMKQISSIDGYEQQSVPYDGYAQIYHLIDDRNYRVQIRSMHALNKVPEEICCKLIEHYKSTPNNDKGFDVREYGNYDVGAEKNKDIHLEGEKVVTTLAIQEKDTYRLLYFVQITAEIVNYGRELDRPNHNRKICEKLTEEYVRL